MFSIYKSHSLKLNSQIMSLDFDVNLESEKEEDPVEDVDTVNSCIFKQQYKQVHQESASLKKKYITHAASDSKFSKIAIGLENEMQVYDVTQTGLSKFVGKNGFGQFDHPVSGLCFFRDDLNIVLASTIAGEIHMYDLRTFSRVHTFEGNYSHIDFLHHNNNFLNLDDSELVVKPVSCFDVNINNRLICAGTDELNQEVYLLFFDIRERRLMGGFFESHREEVTDVKFHPSDPDVIASGSIDGLINIFDCKKESEDDALKYCLNTGDSVAKLKWHHQDKLSCITNTNDLHLYDVNEQDLLKKWDRVAITEAIKRKSVIDCHLIDCYDDASNEMIFLATSNYNKGECLRSVKFTKEMLDPVGNFNGNTQIIRASLYNENEETFFTFGEGAIVSVWKQQSSVEAGSNSNQKEHSAVKKKLKKKLNPY